MHVITFVHNGAARLGALRGQGAEQQIVDLNQADARIPADIISFLEAGESALGLARAALANPLPNAIVQVSDATIQAPIPRPGKIICVGLNYRDHAAESNVALPDYPTIFAKYASCVIGTGETILIPQVTNQVDYEGELAVVIGRRAHNVSEADALSYVAGYMPFNDVSARDYQHRTSQWTLGKTFDTFGPMGPALVTADEVPDPHNLDLRVTIGGEVLQSSNTRYLMFTVPVLIAYLSDIMTLEPGDVIATGTPAGVGAARTPPRFLQPGERVQVEISGLGVLENPVALAAKPAR